MEWGWSRLPATLWGYTVFDWMEIGEVLTLRLVDKRTKETVESAVEVYFQSLTARHPSNDDYLSLTTVSASIQACKSAALSFLLRLQTPPLLALINHPQPTEELTRVGRLVWKLGHPGEGGDGEWAEARWMLVNIELFVDVLTRFDGRMTAQVSEVLMRYSDSNCGRAVKCLLSYLSEYRSGCSFNTEDYFFSLKRLKAFERRFAVVSKLVFLIQHPTYVLSGKK